MSNKEIKFRKLSTIKDPQLISEIIAELIYYNDGASIDENVYKKIYKFLVRMLKTYKNDIRFLQLMGHMYHKGYYVKQDMNKAIRYYKKIKCSSAYYTLAMIYDDMKNYVEASKMYYMHKNAKLITTHISNDVRVYHHFKNSHNYMMYLGRLACDNQIIENKINKSSKDYAYKASIGKANTMIGVVMTYI
jgi:hypothetical protein